MSLQFVNRGRRGGGGGKGQVTVGRSWPFSGAQDASKRGRQLFLRCKQMTQGAGLQVARRGMDFRRATRG